MSTVPVRRAGAVFGRERQSRPMSSERRRSLGRLQEGHGWLNSVLGRSKGRSSTRGRPHIPVSLTRHRRYASYNTRPRTSRLPCYSTLRCLDRTCAALLASAPVATVCQPLAMVRRSTHTGLVSYDALQPGDFLQAEDDMSRLREIPVVVRGREFLRWIVGTVSSASAGGSCRRAVERRDCRCCSR